MTTVTTRSSRTRVKGRKQRVVRKPKVITISAAQQEAEQTSSFASIFHSPLLDTEVLARPIIESELRDESALKYISLWAAKKVNINSAPRHVLEAAFMFGGDAQDIADEIIERRQIEPFESIDDLKKEFFGYSDSIKKSERFITTKSTFFSVKVTATSGVAKTSTVVGIIKIGNKITKVGVITG